jgi:hypothetical protein
MEHQLGPLSSALGLGVVGSGTNSTCSACRKPRCSRHSQPPRTRIPDACDDAQFDLELYRNADPEDSFAHFEEQREASAPVLWGFHCQPRVRL